jgi:hypothetical protein
MLLLCDPAWFEPRLEVEPRAHGARLSIPAEALTEPEDRFDARAVSTQQVFVYPLLVGRLEFGGRR